MNNQNQHDTHIQSYKTLLYTLLSLILLTVITVAVAQWDLGIFNVPTALMIASVKASLVLLIFMHLKYEGAVLQYSFLITIFFLVIMITFTFWDVAFR